MYRYPNDMDYDPTDPDNPMEDWSGCVLISRKDMARLKLCAFDTVSLCRRRRRQSLFSHEFCDTVLEVIPLDDDDDDNNDDDDNANGNGNENGLSVSRNKEEEGRVVVYVAPLLFEWLSSYSLRNHCDNNRDNNNHDSTDRWTEEMDNLNDNDEEPCSVSYVYVSSHVNESGSVAVVGPFECTRWNVISLSEEATSTATSTSLSAPIRLRVSLLYYVHEDDSDVAVDVDVLRRQIVQWLDHRVVVVVTDNVNDINDNVNDNDNVNENGHGCLTVVGGGSSTAVVIVSAWVRSHPGMNTEPSTPTAVRISTDMMERQWMEEVVVVDQRRNNDNDNDNEPFSSSQTLQLSQPKHSLNQTLLPGYEDILQKVAEEFRVQCECAMDTTNNNGNNNGNNHNITLTGSILLTGCVGVGKTTLARAYMKRLEGNHRSNESVVTHYVSTHDLLSLAMDPPTNSTTTNTITSCLKKALLPVTTRSSASFTTITMVVVVDDLDLLLENPESASSDPYRREKDVVWHAVSQLLTTVNSIGTASANINDSGRGCGIHSLHLLGVCRSNDDTAWLTLSGFGSTLEVPPPSMERRVELWHTHLSKKNSNYALTLALARLLASRTSGCVASDLGRIRADAELRLSSSSSIQDSDNNSDHQFYQFKRLLLETAREHVPSLLSTLEATVVSSSSPEMDDTVTHTHTATHNHTHTLVENGKEDLRLRFDRAWNSMGGYVELKRQVYRRVYGPLCAWSSKGRRTAITTSTSTVTGVLFHGPSGCGKTMAAHCLAQCLNLRVLVVRAHDVLDPWVGGSEQRLRTVFRRARTTGCMILLEELDALVSNRFATGGDDANDSVHSRLLSTLLNELDGLSSSSSSSSPHYNDNDTDTLLLVVGTVVDMSTLDPALIRPGRLEVHLPVPRPTVTDLQCILDSLLLSSSQPSSSQPSSPSHTTTTLELAERLHRRHANGADCHGLYREAVLLAIHDDDDDDNTPQTITVDHFRRVLDRTDSPDTPDIPV